MSWGVFLISIALGCSQDHPGVLWAKHVFIRHSSLTKTCRNHSYTNMFALLKILSTVYPLSIHVCLSWNPLGSFQELFQAFIPVNPMTTEHALRQKDCSHTEGVIRHSQVTACGFVIPPPCVVMASHMVITVNLVIAVFRYMSKREFGCPLGIRSLI